MAYKLAELSQKVRSFRHRVTKLAESDDSWITVNGRHVLIRDGETAKDALSRVLDYPRAAAKREQEALDRNKSSDIDRSALLAGTKGLVSGPDGEGAYKFRSGKLAGAAREHVGKKLLGSGYAHHKEISDNVQDVYSKGGKFLEVAGGRRGSPQLYVRRPSKESVDDYNNILKKKQR